MKLVGANRKLFVFLTLMSIILGLTSSAYGDEVAFKGRNTCGKTWVDTSFVYDPNAGHIRDLKISHGCVGSDEVVVGWTANSPIKIGEWAKKWLETGKAEGIESFTSIGEIPCSDGHHYETCKEWKAYSVKKKHIRSKNKN